MAYVTGHFSMTFSPDGETNISDSGTFLEVRERQEDGSWLVTRDMFNSSLPLPAPQ
jgi:ketosteroid isomerase-like protein